MLWALVEDGVVTNLVESDQNPGGLIEATGPDARLGSTYTPESGFVWPYEDPNRREAEPDPDLAPWLTLRVVPTDRLAICHACPQLDAEHMNCRACGCDVVKKSEKPEETCPEGKW
jgi:hypothetical protein